jgi:hypothetical protein
MSEIEIFRQSSDFKDGREGCFAALPPSICQNPAAPSRHSFPPSCNSQTAYPDLQLPVLGVPLERTELGGGQA